MERMKYDQRPFWAFAILSIALVASFVPRIVALSPMYLSSDVRSNAQESLSILVDMHGWILSDISIESVTEEDMTIIRTNHQRYRGEKECFHITFADSSSVPCENR